jgi:hypothetical protein
MERTTYVNTNTESADELSESIMDDLTWEFDTYAIRNGQAYSGYGASAV